MSDVPQMEAAASPLRLLSRPARGWAAGPSGGASSAADTAGGASATDDGGFAGALDAAQAGRDASPQPGSTPTSATAPHRTRNDRKTTNRAQEPASSGGGQTPDDAAPSPESSGASHADSSDDIPTGVAPDKKTSQNGGKNAAGWTAGVGGDGAATAAAVVAGAKPVSGSDLPIPSGLAGKPQGHVADVETDSDNAVERACGGTSAAPAPVDGGKSPAPAPPPAPTDAAARALPEVVANKQAADKAPAAKPPVAHAEAGTDQRPAGLVQEPVVGETPSPPVDDATADAAPAEPSAKVQHGERQMDLNAAAAPAGSDSAVAAVAESGVAMATIGGTQAGVAADAASSSKAAVPAPRASDGVGAARPSASAGSGVGLSASTTVPAREGSAKPASSAQEMPASQQQETFDQIVFGLRGQMDARNGRAEIQLNPPSLGAVRVSVALANGNLTAQFDAQTEVVRQLLTSHMDRLRTVLEGQGITVDRLAVRNVETAPAAPTVVPGAADSKSAAALNPDGRGNGQPGQNPRQGSRSRSGGDFATVWRQTGQPIDLVA